MPCTQPSRSTPSTRPTVAGALLALPTLTGCASARILPHDTASSGRAPARQRQQSMRLGRASCDLWPGRAARRHAGNATDRECIDAQQARASLALPTSWARCTAGTNKKPRLHHSPLSLPSNSCAVLRNTAKSAPFFIRLALQMWCLGTPAGGAGGARCRRPGKRHRGLAARLGPNTQCDLGRLEGQMPGMPTRRAC